MIPQSQWDSMGAVIENSGFFNKPIVWRRCVSTLDRYQEGNNLIYQETTLHVLENYNYMRSWPITIPTESGSLDRQSIQLLFLFKEFKDLGLVTDPGNYIKVDSERDRFIIDGLVYKNMGDTLVSQIGNRDLIVSIIVKREETPTGTYR